MSWMSKKGRAQYNMRPDTRPGGSLEDRVYDPKRPGGADAGRASKWTRRPLQVTRPGKAGPR